MRFSYPCALKSSTFLPWTHLLSHDLTGQAHLHWLEHMATKSGICMGIDSSLQAHILPESLLCWSTFGRNIPSDVKVSLAEVFPQWTDWIYFSDPHEKPRTVASAAIKNAYYGKVDDFFSVLPQLKSDLLYGVPSWALARLCQALHGPCIDSKYYTGIAYIIDQFTQFTATDIGDILSSHVKTDILENASLKRFHNFFTGGTHCLPSASFSEAFPLTTYYYLTHYLPYEATDQQLENLTGTWPRSVQKMYASTMAMDLTGLESATAAWTVRPSKKIGHAALPIDVSSTVPY